mmetsp:Transcript_29357/g.42601  ORF Transcript_29357/g.42601 Transcript_29357/m.42601 type:complete len:127 (+) Transcript_29357:279-659(+)
MIVLFDVCLFVFPNCLCNYNFQMIPSYPKWTFCVLRGGKCTLYVGLGGMENVVYQAKKPKAIQKFVLQMACKFQCSRSPSTHKPYLFLSIVSSKCICVCMSHTHTYIIKKGDVSQINDRYLIESPQ